MEQCTKEVAIEGRATSQGMPIASKGKKGGRFSLREADFSRKGVVLPSPNAELPASWITRLLRAQTSASVFVCMVLGASPRPGEQSTTKQHP